jgi:DNA replication protein DnaC
MNSPTTTPKTNEELTAQLKRLDLHFTAQGLDDLLARATAQHWSPRQLLEEVARSETQDLARRSLERRLAQARIHRFKPMADFNWAWPKKIDRGWVERALTLEFLTQGHNLILCGPHGVGKTMIAKNIAYTAVLAGYTVLFRTAGDLLADLDSDSPGLRRRKFRFYARPALLVVDEVGQITYDSHAADLLFEIVNHRYERNSIVVTTNRGFKGWNAVFPNATSVAALLDRLTHHADITLIQGDSYRLHEREVEAAARQKQNNEEKTHAR